MLRRVSFFLLLGGVALTAAEQTWTGQISDEMCGADHSAMAHDGKKVNAHDCTLACVKNGSKFVFVSEGKVYPIANQDLGDLRTHAGHDVKITGDLSSDGKTITVSKVEMTHLTWR
jgi:hypothetical protein